MPKGTCRVDSISVSVTFSFESANMRIRETWTVMRSLSGFPRMRIPRIRGEGGGKADDIDIVPEDPVLEVWLMLVD